MTPCHTGQDSFLPMASPAADGWKPSTAAAASCLLNRHMAFRAQVSYPCVFFTLILTAITPPQLSTPMPCRDIPAEENKLGPRSYLHHCTQGVRQAFDEPRGQDSGVSNREAFTRTCSPTTTLRTPEGPSRAEIQLEPQMRGPPRQARLGGGEPIDRCRAGRATHGGGGTTSATA